MVPTNCIITGHSSRNADVQLLSILGDMFSAGTETIKITLLWAFVALLRHPDVQQKVHRLEKLKLRTRFLGTELCCQ